MKAGLFVTISIESDGSPYPLTQAYVPVARRVKSIKREPNSGHEAGLAKFMEYRSFHTRGSLGWGGRLVNALITANRGKLPDGWLQDGMQRFDIAETSH
jgi:hypothetical protein